MLPGMGQFRACRVEVRDAEGNLHGAGVNAESLYEAAALGLKLLRDAQWSSSIPSAATLVVTVTSPVVRHSVSVRGVERWLNEPARSPEEKLRKARIGRSSE